jgi:hypothetical protein
VTALPAWSMTHSNTPAKPYGGVPHELLWLLIARNMCRNKLVADLHRAKRREAEYYVAAYAQHYRVPVPLVRAVVERESNWRPCAISPKGAAGLMQIMPTTAQRLGVCDRCNIDQNVSGGCPLLGMANSEIPWGFAAGVGRILRREGHCEQAGSRIPKPGGCRLCISHPSHLPALRSKKTEILETTQKRDIR